jgi:3-hydroxyisobutyrate dehydrogenase-like beta-hydroxyacid dehydrogenase
MVGLGLLTTIAGLFLGWGAMAEALAAPLLRNGWARRRCRDGNASRS